MTKEEISQALKSYPVFLMIQLAQADGLIASGVPYDETWENGVGLYIEFFNSPENDVNVGEYEAMQNFIKRKRSYIPDESIKK